MSNWRRWVRPGLAATIVLALLAVVLRTGGVEQDLTARVSQRLSADGYDWARPAISGRGVEIGGIAPTPEAQAEAVAAVSLVSGVASVVDKSGLLPVASPYVWSARRTGQTLALGGSVPSEATRNAVLALARRALPEANILDQTQLARGAPTGFSAATGFALDRLGEMSEGLVTITDGTLSVAGVASTSQGYAAGRLAFQEKIPAGVTLGPVDIAPARVDPFVWSASLDDESVTLAGFVPNDVVKSELAARAKAMAPELPVIDNMNIASGEPEGFADAAGFAIDALGKLEEGGVMLDGLTLDVAGVARSVDDYDAVVSGIGGSLPPGLEIVANEIIPAPVDDYAWSGTRDGDTIVLSGYVPSLQGRNEVETVARELFSGKSMTIDTKVASGEPKIDWIGGVKFAMEQLSQLETGSVSLRGRDYSVEGAAGDSDAFVALSEANARTLPASLELASSEIAAPRVSPYMLKVGRAPKGVTVVGHAPSADAKRAIVKAAGEVFGASGVDDQISYASGAPDGFVEAATGAMEATARLAGGHFTITDSALEIEGTTFHDRAKARIAGLATDAIPESFKTVVTIVTRQVGQPVDGAGCRDRLEMVLSEDRVDFDKGAAAISQDSYPLLDRIAGVLMRCPESAVEVGGYSDSDGSEEKNLALTQERAQAVLDYLVDAGVRLERLTANGYGEADPIADNTTEAGKAANRRIEFTIARSSGG